MARTTEPSEILDCPRCGFGASHNYCAQCGAALRGPGRATQAGKVAFAPLFEYFEHARAIVFPRRLVREIREGGFGLPELLGFWLAAAALAALANAVFHMPSVTGVDLPILDELADAAAAMAVVVLLYGPLHLLLNRGGRGVRFGHYALTVLAIAALIWPWVTLARGALTQAGTPEASQIATLAGMLFFIRAFAALYARRTLAVVLWLAVYLTILSIALVSLLGPFAAGS